MIKIQIEVDTPDELIALIDNRDSERDELIARIRKLEQEPLRFSRENLARVVLDDFPSLTPAQRQELRTKIETAFV